MVLRCLARAALIAVGNGLDDLAVLIERRLKAARIRHRQRAETSEVIVFVGGIAIGVGFLIFLGASKVFEFYTED